MFDKHVVWPFIVWVHKSFRKYPIKFFIECFVFIFLTLYNNSLVFNTACSHSSKSNEFVFLFVFCDKNHLFPLSVKKRHANIFLWSSWHISCAFLFYNWKFWIFEEIKLLKESNYSVVIDYRLLRIFFKIFPSKFPDYLWWMVLSLLLWGNVCG